MSRLSARLARGTLWTILALKDNVPRWRQCPVKKSDVHREQWVPCS
jgi:hypothetical protein